jgi:hypothetical protein
MKKVLLIAMSLMLVSAAAFAGDARVAGLSLKSWMLTDDDSAVSLFPSLISDFKNEMRVELGTKSSLLDNYAEGNIAIGEKVLGITLNRPVTVSSALLPTLGTSGTWNLVDPGNIAQVTNVFGVTLGIPMDKMDVAAGIEYGTKAASESKKNIGNPEASTDTTVLNLNIGASLKGDVPMDFGLMFGLPLINNSGNNYNASDVKNIEETLSNAGTFNVALDGRAKIGELIYNAEVGFANDSLTSKNKAFAPDTSFSEAASTSTFNLALGAVDNFKLSEGVKFILGAEATINTSSSSDVIKNVISGAKTKDSGAASTSLAVPFYAAIETKLNDNFTGRAGVTQGVWQMTSNSTVDNITDPKIKTQDSSSNPPPGVVSLGLTGKIAKLTIDAVISQNLLFDGPYFIGGNANGLNSNVTVTYNW